jgi:hypothetical protein
MPSVGLCVLLQFAAVADDRLQWTLGADGGWVITDTPLESWVEGGWGKLRYDENTDGLNLYHAFADAQFRISSTVNVKATLNLNTDLSNRLDLLEGYVEWRPVPVTPWRLRFRLGAFYPHISMENIDVAWTSPYTLSFSAINTWLAEELRAIGGELNVSRRLGSRGQHTIGFEGAVFYKNDPTGALLGARGWAAHNRQSGINAVLPLPEGPPWGTEYEPFKELDHRVGYYGGVEYSYEKLIKFKYHHYDNRGDPNQGYSWGDTWETDFDAIGVQLSLPLQLGLLAQYMDGRTVWQGVDDGFTAWYLMLSRDFAGNRISVRYDDFLLAQRMADGSEVDLDDGDVWTVAWMYSYSKHLRFGIEWLQIKSTRPLVIAPELAPAVTENQFMTSVRIMLGNQVN